MMRIHINRNADGLVDYFTSSLSKDDYFFGEGKTVQGYWHGKLVDEFGLDHRVHKKDFSAFAHNRDPKSGERLSVRDTKNRRTSYEYTFSAPKSVSVIMALTGDREILNAHRLAVKKAMQAVEADMHTQVKVEGRNTYQKTGNLLYARFDHFTARPVRETESPLVRYSADPLLHSHCIVPNVTLYKGQRRALEGSVVHSVAPYYEAVYHSHLSKALQEMGYGIARTKDRYEIKGISRRVIEKFSGRTLEIERLAKKLGITDAKKKGELGAKTRLHKSKLKSDVGLKKIWLSRLTPKEGAAVRKAKGTAKGPSSPITPEKAIDRALEHCLERNSAVPAKRLLAHAMTLGYGTLTPEGVRHALKSRTDILYAREGHLTYLTTTEMVKAEDRMLDFAAKGKDTVRAIDTGYKPRRGFLNAQQKKAVHQILNSTDRVSVLSGAAGTGKSTLLIEIKEAVEQKGGQVTAIAPSSGASRGVLREKGFKGADTIAKFLKDREMQQRAKGQVILVDEASLIGVKTMNNIFSVAKKLRARVILSGDVRQHSSPEHGDALRLLQQKAGLKAARVEENLRQQGNPEYKKAIDLLAGGKTRRGFARLDKIGAIVEAGDITERHEKIAEDYLRSVEAGRSTLVISPTHAEGRALTRAIRERMKGRGRIKGAEKTYTIQRNLSLTEAQKKDPAMYESGMTVQFHQNHKGGYVAGRRYEVVSKTGKGQVSIAREKGEKQLLPFAAHRHYQVFRKDRLELAEGDFIRITHNGRSLEKSRLHNGQTFTVRGFTKEGHIRLSNGKTLDKGFGHFTYGHVQTSHAAQGKDCKDVFIAQSAMSFPASNDRQFYVSASRAKETIKIYTDDKEALKAAVSRSGERISAKDIAEGHLEKRRKRQRYYEHLTKNSPDYGRTRQPAQDRIQRPDLDKA